MTKSETVQSALRALQVIEGLNRRNVTPLEVLHAHTGLPKTTLVRLLETLIAAGYVVRVSRREGYALTENVLKLSAGMRHRDVVVDIARPLMEAFTRRHNWQVSLATSEQDCMLVRFTTRHISPFAREEIFLNRRVHMLRSAIGRAYLAFCPPDEREVILNLVEASEAGEIAGAGGREQIAAVTRRVRRDGYATIVWGPDDATRSFAVPILEPDVADRPLGALVMFYYRTVMTEAQAVDRYLGLIRGMADEIATGLQRRKMEVAPQPA